MLRVSCRCTRGIKVVTACERPGNRIGAASLSDGDYCEWHGAAVGCGAPNVRVTVGFCGLRFHGRRKALGRAALSVRR
jgi:hypothetical protein